VINIPFERTRIKAKITHQLNLRDQVQCTQITPDGNRCEQRKWLQVHHIIPISHGGQNELPNLKTLCTAHHQMAHEH